MSDTRDMPLVSIIVLNYNGKDLSLRCLQSLLDFTEYPSYEILVIDNASTDGSVQEIKKVFGDVQRIKVIVLGENSGYAGGNDTGYKNASDKSKYIVILNNDVIVDEKDWLRILVEFLEKHEDVGAAQPLIVDPENDHHIQSCGKNMDPFGDTVELAEILDQLDTSSQESYNECFTVLGAAFITRRELVERVGLFNRRFFLYYEEADFCWRLRLIGSKVVAVHGSKVRHFWSSSTNKYITFPMLYFHFCKNKIYTLLVNYELSNAIRYVPWVFLSYVSDTIGYILLSMLEEGIGKKVSRSRALGTMKSLSYVLVHFPDIWRDRMNVQENIRARPDSEIVGKFIMVIRPTIPKPITSKIRTIASFLKIL